MIDIEASDLVCRARREKLSADEQQRLEQALASSAEARLMNLILKQLDQDSVVRRGDEGIVARIAARPRRGVRQAHTVVPPHRLFLAALVLLLVGGAAGAYLGGKTRPSATVSAAAPSSYGGTLPNASAHSKERAEPESAQCQPAQDVATEPKPFVAQDVAPTAIPRQAATAKNSSDASGIEATFAGANLLRRQGSTDEAVRSYRRIIVEFPAAREAQLARLALAKLLSRSDPNQALTYYRAVVANGGRLRAEALWGVAELSRQLTRDVLEREALTELLRDFPETPYAEVARKRLRDGSP